MPPKPNGKNDRNDRIAFTRGSAERISKVVRQVEAGNRDEAALSFGSRPPPSASPTLTVRMGTFSSPWPRGSTATITFLHGGGTATASNTLISYPAPPHGKATVNCVVAKESATWYLANWEVVTATATIVSAIGTATAVVDISLSASLNTTSCAITIGKTNTTASFSFVSATTSTTIIRLV
jgi:hypothetical protein